MTSEPGDASGGGSFEDRLRTAETRKGVARNVAPASSSSGEASALGIGVKVGVELVSALIVAVAIGFGLDRWLHTSPVLLAVFVLLGGAAGVANVWRLMGRTTPKL